MIKSIKVIFILLATISFLFSCWNSNQDLAFERIWYKKTDDNIRYMTFYVELINKELSDDEIFSHIELHWSKLMNTEWKLTAGFYFLNKEDAIDITNFSIEDIIDKVHDNNPLASYWIRPNGTSQLIRNPWNE